LPCQALIKSGEEGKVIVQVIVLQADGHMLIIALARLDLGGAIEPVQGKDHSPVSREIGSKLSNNRGSQITQSLAALWLGPSVKRAYLVCSVALIVIPEGRLPNLPRV
jgi:hypothetical protein